MTHTTAPRISVTLPNYNDAACLGKALERICAQEVTPFEVLVLDDCSTDNSMEIISSFQERFPFVRAIRYPEKSRNWVEAWASHLHLVEGDYVFSTAADDLTYPGFFKAIGEVAARCPQAGVIFSDFHFIDENQRVFGGTNLGLPGPCYFPPKNVPAEVCRQRNFWESGVASVVRKDALLWLVTNNFAIMGPWMDSTGYAVAAAKYGACYIPYPLGCLRCAGTPGYSAKINKDEKRAAETFREVVLFLRKEEIRPHVTPELVDKLERTMLSCIEIPARRTSMLIYMIAHANDAVQAGQFEQAHQTFSAIVQQHPESAEAHFAFGNFLYQTGKLAEAEESFRRATQLNPNLAPAQSNLAICSQVRSALDLAMTTYQESKSRDPNFANELTLLTSLPLNNFSAGPS